jgi:ribosomal protein S8E
MEKLRQERAKWRTKSKQNAAKAKEEKLNDKAAAALRKNLAKSRAEQFKLLTKAMVYRIEGEEIMLLLIWICWGYHQRTSRPSYRLC